MGLFLMDFTEATLFPANSQSYPTSSYLVAWWLQVLRGLDQGSGKWRTTVMNEWNSWWASQWRICSYISGPGRLVTGGWCCGAWLPEALPRSLSPEKSGKFSELGPLLSGRAPVQNASVWNWRCGSVVEGLLGMHQGLVTWFGVGALACVGPWIPSLATQPLS